MEVSMTKQQALHVVNRNIRTALQRTEDGQTLRIFLMLVWIAVVLFGLGEILGIVQIFGS